MKSAIETTFDVVGGKWKGVILWKMLDVETIRFNELKRALGGKISSRILSKELRMLCDEGLIERKDYHSVPPKVEYCLTEYGKSIEAFMVPMNEWGLQHQSRKESKGEMIVNSKKMQKE
ncbi:winged helix-turn-helix transcriptional regulator [Thalassobacillus hwangdonensis]|uniref:winged helix-turn-helix transcriptional regulator n=1 Tax=Thalassobacillus hwangdonensis TaxID=546108 RepID=UPI0036D9BD09